MGGVRVLKNRTLAPTWEGSFWASSIREVPCLMDGFRGWWVEGRLDGRIEKESEREA
jgi:hypothetical protein